MVQDEIIGVESLENTRVDFITSGEVDSSRSSDLKSTKNEKTSGFDGFNTVLIKYNVLLLKLRFVSDVLIRTYYNKNVSL